LWLSLRTMTEIIIMNLLILKFPSFSNYILSFSPNILLRIMFEYIAITRRSSVIFKISNLSRCYDKNQNFHYLLESVQYAPTASRALLRSCFTYLAATLDSAYSKGFTGTEGRETVEVERSIISSWSSWPTHGIRLYVATIQFHTHAIYNCYNQNKLICTNYRFISVRYYVA
jgi:hypothetical protein